MSDRLSGIDDAWSGGAVDCASEVLKSDMGWLIDEVKRLREERHSLRVLADGWAAKGARKRKAAIKSNKRTGPTTTSVEALGWAAAAKKLASELRGALNSEAS